MDLANAKYMYLLYVDIYDDGPATQGLAVQPFFGSSDIWSIYSLLFTQFCSYLTHKVSLKKGCAVSLNQGFISKVKVIEELCVKSLSGAYFLSRTLLGPKSLIIHQ